MKNIGNKHIYGFEIFIRVGQIKIAARDEKTAKKKAENWSKNGNKPDFQLPEIRIGNLMEIIP